MKKVISVLFSIILCSSLVLQPITTMAEGTDGNISEISQITSDSTTEVEDVDNVDEEESILDSSEDIISEETIILEEDENSETETIISEDNSNESSVENTNEEESVVTERANVAESPSISYSTHVQTYGWQDWVSDSELSGTIGQSKQLEGIQIQLNSSIEGSIQYRTHVQNIGWQDWVVDGALSGTTGQSKQLEAIQIQLTGEMAEKYDIYYRVHSQQFGWLDWAKNGESAGTSGYSYRAEAVQIVLVEKGGAAPGSTMTPFKQAPTSVSYSTHIQSIGWQSSQKNGATSGVTGQSKRLEAIKINLSNKEYSGSIQYRTHVQNIGWQDWVADGALSGTTGQSKQLEAIQIQLTGEMAERYDVYYRVHSQQFGWLDWAKNGESAGTSGYSYRAEAVQIVLVEKGGAAPGNTTTSFKQAPTFVTYSTHIQNIGWQSSQKNGATSGVTGQSKRLEAIKVNLSNKEYSGSIQYRTHVQNIGWQEWVADGALSGTTNQAKQLEAIQIQLTGEMAEKYDVYYRVHVQNFGWLDWAKNGESAGTSGYSYRAEAIQIVLVEKGGAAPGSTATPFKEAPKTQTKITTKSYKLTLNQAATMQMSVSPQTDTPWSALSAAIQEDIDLADIVSSRSLTSGLSSRASWTNASQAQVTHFLDQSNFPSEDDSFYQFLVLSSPAGVDATEVNSKILNNAGVLTNKASSFIEAAKQYNVNEIYLISHAMLETGNGTSQLATGVEYNGTTVYNVYGIGAVDSDPINQGAKKAYEEGWTSVEKAIIGGAKFIGQGYVNNGQDTLYKMRWNPDAMEVYGYAHHQYASDVAWAVKQTARIAQMYRQLDSYNITFEVPQYK